MSEPAALPSVLWAFRSTLFFFSSLTTTDRQARVPVICFTPATEALVWQLIGVFRLSSWL